MTRPSMKLSPGMARLRLALKVVELGAVLMTVGFVLGIAFGQETVATVCLIMVVVLGGISLMGRRKVGKGNELP